jgi:hypothetical protein
MCLSFGQHGATLTYSKACCVPQADQQEAGAAAADGTPAKDGKPRVEVGSLEEVLVSCCKLQLLPRDTSIDCKATLHPPENSPLYASIDPRVTHPSSQLQ